MKQVIISCYLMLLCALGLAQEKQSFSLDEAIKYALEHNRTVVNAQKDIEAAKKQKWQTTATGLPQISANVDYQNWLKQQISLIPAEFVGGNEGEFAELIFGTKQSVNMSATLNQLIFDGSYLVGLQSAKVYLDISKNAKRKTDIEIRKSVIDAYGNVLLAKESLEILYKNEETVSKNLDETQKTYENGFAEEESVEQLQITLSQIQSNINNAKRLKDIAYKMLNIIMGRDLNSNLILSDSLDDLVIKSIIPELAKTELSIEDNIDYIIAKNNEKSNELLLKYEKTKALPSLNAFVAGYYDGYNDEFKFLSGEQDWFDSALFGVSLNIPIFSSLGRSAATQQAKINYEKSQLDLTETEQQILLQLETAKSNYQFGIEEYNTSKRNLELAERIEYKNQIKYKEGLASSFQLRDAQTQLYDAQNNYLNAMLNVINYKTELESILNSNINQ